MNISITHGYSAYNTPVTQMEVRIDGISKTWTTSGNYNEEEMLEKFDKSITMWMTQRCLAMIHDLMWRLEGKGII